MTPGILLAQCKSTWRSKLDLEYLDETSATKRMQMLQKGNAIGAKLDQFANYASKELQGQVHVAGYLHDQVAKNPDGTFTHPRHLENNKRKRRITRLWSRKLRAPVKGRGGKQDVIQHRLVFSMSAELHASCLKAGLSPEQVLHQSMKRIMRRFQERFYPDDAITYAYGFHHDTEHLHVHVALCPRTKKGFYVGFSTPKNRSRNRSGHKDQFTFVRRCCESENRKWEELLESPEQLAQLQTQRHGERFVFHPRQRPPKPGPIQRPNIFSLELNRRYRELTALQNRLHQIEQEHRQARLEARAASFFQWKTTKHLARNVRDRKRSQLKELRQQFFLLHKAYLRDLRIFKKYTPQYGSPISQRHAQIVSIRN